MLTDYLPRSPEEYIACFRQIAALIERAMDQAEKREFGSTEERQRTLGNLAEGVELLASLRGNNALFNEIRPVAPPHFQLEMYKFETQLRERLIELGYAYPPHPVTPAD